MGVLGAIVAGVTALPLAWVAPIFAPDDLPLTYSGTIWSGEIGNIPVFDRAQITPKPPSFSADITAGNGTNFATGQVYNGGARDMTLQLNIASLPITDQRLSNLRGMIRANVSDIQYNAKGCISASGTVTTDVLQRNGGAVDWVGPALSGPISCEDGNLRASLSGRDADQEISADVTLMPDSIYRALIRANSQRPEADAILPLFGFTRDGRDFQLTEQGRWR